MQPAARPTKEGDGAGHSDYFNGFIGQMGTQFDALGHMGSAVKMADGTVKSVYYNGFTEEELTGTNRGLGRLEALGVEHMKPFITRGILIDIAAAKGVPTLPAAYEVTMADVRAALTRQKMSEATIEQGDAVLFHYGWSVNWTNPSKSRRQPGWRRRKQRIPGHRWRGRPLARHQEGFHGRRR